MAKMDEAEPSEHPLVADLEDVRRKGREIGRRLENKASSCPFPPTEAERHRAWMDGFSQGRIDAGK